MMIHPGNIGVLPIEVTPNQHGVKPMQLEGRKDDQGKEPWELAPWDAFRAIVLVLRFGAAKYAPRNWEKGMAWSRPFGALQRHLVAWWNGEGPDPETGMSHLWHAGCCVMFLIAYEIRGVGLDDRPRTHHDTTPATPQQEITLDAEAFLAQVKSGLEDVP